MNVYTVLLTCTPLRFPQDPATLRNNTREVAATLLSAGIDPSQSIMFNQSQVPAHTELAWIFNCVARLGWLNRMTQFKDKAGKNRDGVSAGLYIYPTLMAADILAYKATHVPVGEDQKQHLELTRDIAVSFNDNYAVEHFPLVEPLILGEATRVMNLRDGTKKMSKSDQSDYSRINLTDSSDAIASKIQKARTDSDPLPESVDGLADRPEATNLVGIYAALADISREKVLQEYGGAQFSQFKKVLVELAIEVLSPLAGELSRLLKDQGEIDRVLRKGAEEAQALAEPIAQETRRIVGFLEP